MSDQRTNILYGQQEQPGFTPGWQGDYQAAVKNYTQKEYLKARQLINRIKTQYAGKYNADQIMELENKIKSRIGM